MPNKIILKQGALPRPPDPNEDKYRRARSEPPPSGAEMSKPMILATPSADPRPAIFYQGGIGSCAACSSSKAAETAQNYRLIQGRQSQRAQAINPGPVYAKARMLRGWFPNDTGSYVADCLDFLMTGSPLLSDGAYLDNPAADYIQLQFRAEADYEKGHQPFYPSEGFVLERIWLALRDGLPIVQGGYWPNQWNQPRGGKVATGITNFGVSGHATYIWGIIPGWVLCANSWSENWSSDAASFGFQMRRGDFAVPWEYYSKSPSPFWEFRAITPEFVAPEPVKPDPIKPDPMKPDPVKPEPPKPPDPQPPKPEPRHVIFTGSLGKVKAGGNLIVTPDAKFQKTLAALKAQRVSVDMTLLETLNRRKKR